MNELELKKVVQISMLPTSNPSRIWTFRGELQMRSDGSNAQSGSCQHIYFTSNEEIKEGDLRIGGNPIMLTRHKSEDDKYIKRVNESEKFKQYGFRKVIATSDETLGVVKYTEGGNVINGGLPCILPQIPDTFLKTYVEAKGLIKEVRVDYETYYDNNLRPSEGNWIPDKVGYDGYVYNSTRLKVNPDNTVNVSSARLFTLDEVILLLFKFENREVVNTDLGTKESSLSWIQRNLY